ncbi:hypothetical protein FAVG1_07428 [Fusarium avenaceum]|nr:hypothetical protein FAVG1_07428 [Fusarium avenaceum]
MNPGDIRPGSSQPPNTIVMNPGDIRLGSPRPSDERIRSYLLSRPPLYQSFDETSGIDCLTMVLRRLHAHTMLGSHGFLGLRSFQDAEQDNATIRHSWQKFGTEHQERHDATNSWKMLKIELGRHGLRANSPFGDLCNSALMNKTYWSQNEMRLLDAVDRSFGIFEREGKPTLHRPARPYIFRVLYNPGSQQRLLFQELRGLILPFWTETGDRNDPFDKSGTAPYVLLAVVRIREKLIDQDYTRMYACQGSEIVCRYEPPHFLRTDWSVGDADNNMYMLFYGVEGVAPFGDPTTFPEVEPPSLDDDDLKFLQGYMEVLDKHNAEMLAEREAGAAENSQENARTPGQDGIFPSRPAVSIQRSEEMEAPVWSSQPVPEQSRPTKYPRTDHREDPARPQG